MRFLVYLHLVAVSLLASYRTGLKIALWHSLLLFVVLYAQAALLLPPVDVEPGRAVALDRLPVLNVTAFWLFALATSLFSAMNEKELRQRRADLESLVGVGARLDDEGDPVRQASIVLDGLVDRYGFPRGLVLGVADDRLVIARRARRRRASSADVRRDRSRRGAVVELAPADRAAPPRPRDRAVAGRRSCPARGA